MNRREFCKKGLLIAGGLVIPLTALELFNPERLLAEKTAPARPAGSFWLTPTNVSVAVSV